MSDDIQHCAVIDLAEEVYSKLRVKEIPPEFEPTTHNLFHLLADIRHQFTNYDELLSEYGEVGRRGATGLGILCLKHTDDGGTCTDDSMGLGAWQSCPTLSEIYIELKCRASDLAEKAYERWLERQQKKVKPAPFGVQSTNWVTQLLGYTQSTRVSHFYHSTHESCCQY